MVLSTCALGVQSYTNDQNLLIEMLMLEMRKLDGQYPGRHQTGRDRTRTIPGSNVKMLTQNSLKIVNVLYWQAALIRIIPFAWNYKQFVAVPISSARSLSKCLQLTLHLLFCLWIWGCTTFIWVEYFRHRDSFGPTESEHRVRGMLQVNFGMVYALMSLNMYNTLKRRHEIGILFNQFFHFARKTEEYIAPERRKRKWDITELFLVGLLLAAYGHSFVGAVFFLEDPMSPRYLYSLFGERFPSVWVLLGFAVFEYFTYVVIWQQAIFIGAFCLCYFHSINSWLREIHCVKGGSETGGTMLYPKNSYPVYRSLQLLGQGFKACFSGMLFPWFNFFLILIPVITNTYTIKYHSQMSPIAFIAGVVVTIVLIIAMIIVFPKAAAVNTLSMAYLKSLSKQCGLGGGAARPTSGAISKKHVKGCFPLKVKFGSFGFIQRFTTLKMIGLIFYWTMRVLLLTRTK